MKEKKLNISEILQILRQNKPFLRKNFKVLQIGVFGSYARGQQRSESDIDILVQVERPLGLFTFLKLENYLSELLGKKVDLLTVSGLKPCMRNRILKEVKYA